VVGLLKRAYQEVQPIDARSQAETLGEPRVANTVMLGALGAHLSFSPRLWREVVTDLVPSATVEVNLQALEQGWKLGDRHP
jgi:indolepyruvate ferredoxin oxidoreductase beta subunit